VTQKLELQTCITFIDKECLIRINVERVLLNIVKYILDSLSQFFAMCERGKVFMGKKETLLSRKRERDKSSTKW